MQQKTLVVLLGPTGVGKTELSLRLATYFGSPIINADSRQLYKDIPVGTAAPTLEERERVEHYFVGTHQLEDYYSAAQYENDVIKLLDKLFQNHDVVLLTGGSMMYIDAVCKGIDDIPTIDNVTRERMRERYEQEGLDVLVEELRNLDPEYHAVCDLKNPKRVVHALEICTMTGKTYTSFRLRKEKVRPFRIIKIGLKRPREELFERINSRVDAMVEKGLIEEAKRVLPYRHFNSLNTVGFKELFQYFDGTWDLDFALEKIRRNSRVYAKKQITWFSHDKEIVWFHPEQEHEILAFLESSIKTTE